MISLIEGLIFYILEIEHHGLIYPLFGGLGEANGRSIFRILGIKKSMLHRYFSINMQLLIII